MKSMFSYAAGDIMIKIFGILLVPITTRLLSVSDYGIMSLFSALAGFIIVIQFAGMDSALPAFLAVKDSKEKDSVLKTALLPVSWVMLLSLPLWGLLLVFGRVELETYFKTSLAVLIFSGLFSFSVYPFFYWLLYNLRFLNLSSEFIKLNTANVIGVKIIFILCALFTKMRLLLYFVISIISTLLLTLYSWRKFFSGRIEPAAFKPDLLKKMFIYGLPLLPAGLAYSSMVYVDRFMIAGFLSTAALGAYALALTMSTTVNIMHGWFTLAWSPYLIELISTRPVTEYNKRINSVLAMISSAMLAVAAIGIVLSVYLVRIFASAEYHEAAYIFPLLSVWASLNAAHVVANCGIIISKKSNYSLPVILAGLILNILLNIILIPKFKAQGAALALVGGEFLIVMLWLGLTNLVLKSASIKLFSFLPQFALAFVLALLFSFNTGFMGISFLGKLAIGLAVSSLIILYGYLFIKKEDGHVIIRIREEIKKLGVKFSHVQSQDRPQI